MPETLTEPRRISARSPLAPQAAMPTQGFVTGLQSPPKRLVLPPWSRWAGVVVVGGVVALGVWSRFFSPTPAGSRQASQRELPAGVTTEADRSLLVDVARDLKVWVRENPASSVSDASRAISSKLSGREGVLRDQFCVVLHPDPSKWQYFKSETAQDEVVMCLFDGAPVGKGRFAAILVKQNGWTSRGEFTAAQLLADVRWLLQTPVRLGHETDPALPTVIREAMIGAQKDAEPKEEPPSGPSN